MRLMSSRQSKKSEVGPESGLLPEWISVHGRAGGCRGYGDSHGYGYGMGMGTMMNPHGFCG